MQLAAPEALDFSKESREVLRLYGLDPGVDVLPEGDQPDRGGRLLRPEVPGRPPPAGARGPVRPGLERQRQRVPPPELGQPRGRRARPRPARAGDGPGRVGPDRRPETARDARRHADPLDDRVRPDAVEPGREGPRPQPVLLHELAGRRRGQGGDQRSARATSGGTSRSTASTRPRSTTSTPPSCTCSGSTTPG